MDAEKQKTVSEAEHLRRADAFQVIFHLNVFKFLFFKTEEDSVKLENLLNAFCNF